MSNTPPATTAGPLLETEGLGRRFGGLSAVEDVSIGVRRGEIRAVIGPNGAGKTTLVGMICGRVRPSAGRVCFEGRDVTGMPAWKRVAAGIVYTFQVTSIYGTLAVRDNVALAAQRRLMGSPGAWLRLDEAALAARVEGALHTLGLDVHRDRRAGDLPYGHQRPARSGHGARAGTAAADPRRAHPGACRARDRDLLRTGARRRLARDR